MQSRRNTGAGRKLSQSLKTTGKLNFQEAKKLNCSVDKIQRELEKRCRDLSLQQSILLDASRRRNARRGSFPASPAATGDDEEKKDTTGKHLRALSDSALEMHASESPRFMGKNVNATGNFTENEGGRGNRASLPSPLKLPNIVNPKDKNVKSVIDKVQNLKLFQTTGAEALNPIPKSSNKQEVIPASLQKISGLQTRRGSSRVRHLSFVPPEDPISTRRRLSRRQSCPNLGWTKEMKTLANEKEEANFREETEELKKCRYLRFPNSIKEDEEEFVETSLVDL